MDSFCGSAFWDLNTTWYTDNPDFTPCFEKTVFVWIPSGFLWIFAGVEISYALKRPKANGTTSALHICILFFTFVGLALNLIRFVYSFIDANLAFEKFPADHVAPGLKATNYMIAGGIHMLNKQRGVKKSLVLFIYWLLSACFGVFQFQTTLRNPPLDDDKQLERYAFEGPLADYLIVVIVLLLHIINDSIASSHATGTSNETNKPCPKSSAPAASVLTFHWVWSLIHLGYKKPLEFADLWSLSSDNRSKDIVENFNKHWKPNFRKCQEAKNLFGPENRYNNRTDAENILLPADGTSERIASIIPALWKANWKPFVFGSSLKLTSTFLMFLTPKLLDLIIKHVSSDEELWKGFLYAVLMWVIRSVDIFLQEHYNMSVIMVGLRTRSALACAVYQKSLVISNAERKETTTGEIINLMSIDSQRFNELIMFVNIIWCAPIQISLALYFIWEILGPAIFAGLGVLLLLVPANILIGHWRKILQVKLMECKDQRVKLMNEILAGVKVLKFYTWEPSFENSVEKIRRRELSILRKEAYLDSFIQFIWYAAPLMVTVVIFGTYVLMDPNNVLDARKAFVSLTLLNMMRHPLSYLPYVVVLATQTKVSLDRLNKFLNSDEIDPSAVTHMNQPDGSAVSIKGGTFSWDENPILRNINMKVKKGSLVAIVGVVGSGKSSLLSAILGEMGKQCGEVNTSGSIAYVAQQAWIQNDTVRGNILFGRSYDSVLYNCVINACALQPDLEILPGGDDTEIGEKGINLSGGQKQRVALARAVYHNADVYLLDDPLSAVDSHVGKHIFKEVIGPNGLLRNKTRVLVTHGLMHLQEVDCIFVMTNGEVSEVGTFQELLQKKGAFGDFLAGYLSAEDLDAVYCNLTPSSECKARDSASVKQNPDPPLVEASGTKPGNQLVGAEKTETGGVKTSVYLHYLKNIGWSLSVLVFLFHAILHGLTLFSNIWLSKWTSEIGVNGTQDASKRDVFLGVYSGIGLGQAVSAYLASLLLVLGSLRAARFLHNQMLKSILRSPMSFFDTTPVGRILNRFSKDVEIADSNFPSTARLYLNLIFQICVTFIAIIYSTPVFAAVAVPISVLYYFIQRYFVTTSRQLKRLESVLRSPVFSHFSETLNGVSTIRSFSVQSRFISEAEYTFDRYQMAYFSTISANRWLGMQVQNLGNLITFFAALFAVISRPAAGIVGLSLTYALSITDLFYWMVRLRSEVESNVVSIERIKEYGENPEEAAWEIPDEKPHRNWPQRGQIIFKNFQARYREGLDLVLKNISCEINPGEKVGIVGRTGAGKSSMALGLFRIMEAAGGSIEIDGIDISKLGLHDVRGKLTIIPQDPILFAGTLRMNLDPDGKYLDGDIWRALESAHLKNDVLQISDGLQHIISENGDNLSVGQKQLVCLARALLRKSKILILDEATAAVDLGTDDLIQQTIRREFHTCTVLTIAHRINTVMDYDRVMVLEDGEILEYGEPKLLLQDSSSAFFNLARSAGLA